MKNETVKRGILFDLDGTLWDSSREVADSWLLALKDCPEIKKTITREDIQSVMGKVMNEIADILFSEVPPRRRMEILEHCVQVENKYIEAHGGILMEGLKETLTELRRDYHLYIVSNCQTGYIEAFLKHHKLEQYFEDFESYGATGRPKGENIRLVARRNHLDWAVYVGDTQGDYDAAVFAGMAFIQAKMGYGSINARVPAIQTFSQLPEAVREHIAPIGGSPS